MGGEGKETTREGPVLDERTARPRSGRVGVSPQTHNSSGSIELRGEQVLVSRESAAGTGEFDVLK